MRFFSIVTALVVTGALYLLVFERDAIVAFASGGTASSAEEASISDASDGASSVSAVQVVAMRSQATVIDSAVLLRGRTEAARQVDVRSETTGQVVSEPLRKGTSVEAGDLLCRVDPGTRESVLREAEARLAQARAGVPEAQARLIEAEARLAEAEINDRAARQLVEDGFASQTRVAATAAGVEAARAGVESARSGLEASEAGITSAEAAVAAAKKEIERLTITAPFAGLLESDTAEIGTLLQPGALCATVIQLNPIKLVGFVPETEVDAVAVGAVAGGRLATGREVLGRVTFLSRSADETTRTFRTEIEVDNTDLRIRDGQTVEIAIGSDGANAHLLPQSSLTLNDEGALGVRLVGAENVVEFAPVTVLRDTREGIWVSGLPEEVAIIVVGQEFVTDGVLVDPTYREANR